MREMSFLSLLYYSPYRNIIPWDEVDPFHTNNVELLPAVFASSFPMFKTGDVLISMLTPSTLFVLDESDLRPKWMLNGKFRYQHDPDFMPDGTIGIFDNHGLEKPEVGFSRLVDIDPSDGTIMWTYEGTPEEPFYSYSRGSHQILGSGNTLITESNHGRVFEITPDGEIVWEFISPSLEGESIGVVNWATRHDIKDLPFMNGSQAD